MKRLSIIVGLTLAFGALNWSTLANAGNSGSEGDPDQLRVLWQDEAQEFPAFVPAAVIGDLDLTSPETVDLSHTPLRPGQAASLKYFLFYEPQTEDGCLTLPTGARIGPSPKRHALSPIEFLRGKELVAIGEVTKVVPGWETGYKTPALVAYLRIEDVLRDIGEVAIRGQSMAIMQFSAAELVISGRRLCTEDRGTVKAEVGHRYLLFGYPHEVEHDRIQGSVFEIHESIVYPDPLHYSLKDTEAISLAEIADMLRQDSGQIK